MQFSKNPPFHCRLFALFYDLLLVISICLIGSLLALCFTHGYPIQPQNPYFQALLFFLIFSFFIGFWCFGGQTAGMRAWKLYLVMKSPGDPVNATSIHPSFWRAVLRFFLVFLTQSCGGLGWLWIIIDPDRQTLYDRLSGTRVIYSEK